jgi:beta-glucosidase
MGNALADVIFGDYDPAGRLVQTWPRSIEQLPPMMDYNIRDGRTYMYFQGKPLYPFGYGLSYTAFAYSSLKLSSGKLESNGGITVSVNVRNTGKMEGDEVVQLYVKHLDSQFDRPSEELRGFKRVTLKLGEMKTVEIQLAAASVACWDESKHSFAVEKDRIKIMVGSSSADIKLEKTIPVVAGK